MIKLILYSLLMFFCVTTYAQTYEEWSFEDYHDPSTNILKSGLLNEYAPNGIAFTPQGEFHILIVCAGFGTPYDDYSCGNWATGIDTTPDWVNDKSTFYNQSSDFATYSSLNNPHNISRFYYEMSQQDFELLADVYPNRINIDPTGSTNWGSLTRKVFEQMKVEDPNFDWSPYDNRTNYPNYGSDNSNSQPDSIPDFVVVLFRYNAGWSNQPISGMNTWAGSQGGYAALSGLSGFDYNGYTFHSDGGYTHCSGTSSMFGLFIHEVAHSVFDCPHYGGANSVVGRYFYGQTGWGMMNLGSGSFSSALGWERWYLDWIELTSNGVSTDIKQKADLSSNGEYILGDFITTGDVIRVKVPNGTGNNQYLWLENHQGMSIFDNRGWQNDGCSNPLPNSPRGIVAYIESIHDDKNAPFSFWSDTHTANGIKIINPNGSFDYLFGSASTPCNLWGNQIYNLTENRTAPMSGQTRTEFLRFDLNSDNSIYVNSNVNSTSPKNEQHWVAQRNGIYYLDLIGGDISFDQGDKMGISENSLIINRPIYNYSTRQLSPYYLNGISVTVLQEYSNGDVRIKIEYDDVDIDKEINWSGDIVLTDITQTINPDLNIMSGSTLRLLKGQTANRHTKLNGAFVNPTQMSCQENSLLKLNSTSFLVIEDESSLILESGSTLEVEDEAIVYVKTGGSLQVNSGATVNIKGNGKVIVECNGNLCIMSGASIELEDSNSTFNLLSGANIEDGCLTDFSGVVSGNGSIQTFSSQTLTNLTINSDQNYYGTNITTSNVTVTGNDTDVQIEAEDVIFSSILEVQLGATLTVYTYANTCN